MSDISTADSVTDNPLSIEEVIEKDLDVIMHGIHNLYDISKALPHPYDAYNDQTNMLLHDFAKVAFKVKRFIDDHRENNQPVSDRVLLSGLVTAASEGYRIHGADPNGAVSQGWIVAETLASMVRDSGMLDTETGEKP